jgi:hypothetical protein
MKKKKGNGVVKRPIRNGCSKRAGPRDEKNILRVEKIMRKTFREHCNLQTLLLETQISLRHVCKWYLEPSSRYGKMTDSE